MCNFVRKTTQKRVIFSLFLAFCSFFPLFVQKVSHFLRFFDVFSPLSTHRCCCLHFALFLFSPVLRTCETLYVPHCGLRQQQLRPTQYAIRKTHYEPFAQVCRCPNRIFPKNFYSLLNKHLRILLSLKSQIFRPKCASSSNYRERVLSPPLKKTLGLNHDYRSTQYDIRTTRRYTHDDIRTTSNLCKTNPIF